MATLNVSAIGLDVSVVAAGSPVGNIVEVCASVDGVYMATYEKSGPEGGMTFSELVCVVGSSPAGMVRVPSPCSPSLRFDLN